MLEHQLGKSWPTGCLQSGQNLLTLKLPRSHSMLISGVISRDILLAARDCRHLQLRFPSTCWHQQKVSHTVSRCPAWLEKAQRTQNPPEAAMEGSPWRYKWPVHHGKGSLPRLLLLKAQLKTFSKY